MSTPFTPPGSPDRPPGEPQQPPPPPPPPVPGPPAAPPGAWASDQYRAPGAGFAVPERPQSLAIAVTLMYVGAALSVLGMVLSLVQRDEIREQIVEDNNGSLSQDEIDAAVAVGLAFAVIITLVSVGLWIWMAQANGRGQSWARIVATVFGGINIGFSVLGLLLGGMGFGQTTPLSEASSLVGAALAAVILVLLYRPDSSDYYRAMSR